MQNSHRTQTKDLGYPFQFEIFYHMNLKLMQKKCTQYEVGYEVDALGGKSRHSEDVTCGFTLLGEKSFFSIQTKSKQKGSVRSEITRNSLFDRNSNLYLRRYFEILLKRRNLLPNTVSKFILIFNAKLRTWTGQTKYPKKAYDNKMEDISIDTVEDSEVYFLFEALRLRGAKVQRFAEDNNSDITEVVKEILFEENELSDDVLKHDVDYIRNNFIIISECPDYYYLRETNDELAVKIAEENQDSVSSLFSIVLREKLTDHIKYYIEDKKAFRHFCAEPDFRGIFNRSSIETKPDVDSTLTRFLHHETDTPTLRRLYEVLRKITNAAALKLNERGETVPYL